MNEWIEQRVKMIAEGFSLEQIQRECWDYCHREYLGEDMEIGFKGALLSEVLSNLDSDRVQVALQSKDKPAIFTPISEDDVLALLMPMMIQ